MSSGSISINDSLIEIIVGVIVLIIGYFLVTFVLKKYFSPKAKIEFYSQQQAWKSNIYKVTVIVENKSNQTAEFVKFHILADYNSGGYFKNISTSGTADTQIEGIKGSLTTVYISKFMPSQKAIISLDSEKTGDITIVDINTDAKYNIIEKMMKITIGEPELNPFYRGK